MEELIKMMPQKIFKTLEDMERSEINYSKLVYKSGDNKHFDFNRFGPLSSFYLKLMNGDIGMDVVKLNMMSSKKRQIGQKKRKQKKKVLQKNTEDVLKNDNALHNGLNIIVDAFEKRIFEYEGRSKIDVDYDLDTCDSDTYNLIDKELGMFKKYFKYDNPSELWDALIDADEKKYCELKNDIKITQNVLNEEIENKVGVKCTRLKNLVNAVKNVLNNVIEHDNGLIDVEMPDLESKESAEKRRN